MPVLLTLLLSGMLLKPVDRGEIEQGNRSAGGRRAGGKHLHRQVVRHAGDEPDRHRGVDERRGRLPGSDSRPACFAMLPDAGGRLAVVPGRSAALYYAMSYLLIGAAFLGIGAQASTAREVQILSMPITMGQVGLLFLANFAISASAWCARHRRGGLSAVVAVCDDRARGARRSGAAASRGARLARAVGGADPEAGGGLVPPLGAQQRWSQGPLVEAAHAGRKRCLKRRPFARTSRGRRGRARLRAYRQRGSRQCRLPPTGELRALHE